jgi:hypothetical protein
MKINGNGINRIGINQRGQFAYPTVTGVTGTSTIGTVTLILTNTSVIVNNGVVGVSVIGVATTNIVPVYPNGVVGTSVINTPIIAIPFWNVKDDFGFNTGDSGKWAIMSSSVTQITTAQANGLFVITPNTSLASGQNGYLGRYTGSLGLVAESGTIFHVSQAAGGNVETRFGFIDTSGQFSGFGISGSNLVNSWTAGTATPIVSVTSTAKWFRLWHDGTQLNYETSSNGTTWTAFDFNFPSPIGQRLLIGIKVNGANALNTPAYIDSIGINGADNWISVNGFATNGIIGAGSVTVDNNSTTVILTTGALGTSVINSPTSVTADASLTLTVGIIGTSVIGVATGSGASNNTVTGVIGTSVINSATVTINNDISVAVSGVVGSSVINTPITTADSNNTSTGVIGNSIIRSVTVDALTSPIVTGVYALSVINVGTESGTASVSPNGVIGSSVIGTANSNGDSNNAITGVHSDSAIGAATASVNNDVTINVTGIVGTSVIYNDTESGDASKTITGVYSDSVIGLITIEANETNTVSGVSASSVIGTSSVTADASTTIIGVFGNSIINSGTIDGISSLIIDAIGVYGLSIVGIPTVYIQQDTIENVFGVEGVSVINSCVIQTDVPPQIVYANTQPIYRYGGGGGGCIATHVRQYHKKTKRKKMKIHSIKIITEDGKKPIIRIIKS